MVSATIRKHENLKKVLILETMGTKLVADKEAPYTFVGPCAEFDVVNENDRNYDKDDYLSHFDYLLPEIQENALLGQMDHRDEYVPEMKAISHMVKDLWYDEKTKQVMIKIQLLATREGKDAMAIADAGAPIYISSRASGFIDDSGNVSLERIYTYDIVYRPGFRKAKLVRIGESKNTKGTSSRAIYEWAEPTINKKLLAPTMADKNTENETFINKGDFDSYTKKVSGFFDEIKKMITESKAPVSIPAGKHQFGNASAQSIPINEEDTVKDIAPKADDTATKQDAELLKKVTEIQDAIADGSIEKEAIVEFCSMLGKRVNSHSKYVNEVSKFSNEIADAVDMVNEKFDRIVKFVNIIAERLNEVESDTVNTSESINAHAAHSNLIAKRVNTMAGYSSMLGNEINQLNESISTFPKSKVEEATKPAVVTNESARVLNFKKKIQEQSGTNKGTSVKGKAGELTKSVNQILEEVKKKKTAASESINEEKQYPFTNLLDSQTKAQFLGLDPVKKKEIASMVAEKKITVASEIAVVVKQINEGSDAYLRLLSAMPKKVVPVWESMKKADRNRIVSLYNMKGITNHDDAELFWEGLDFGDTKTLERVNEDANLNGDHVPSSSDASALGYSEEEVDSSF